MARKETANVLLERALFRLKETAEPAILNGRWLGNCRVCGKCDKHSPYCLIERIEIYLDQTK